MSSALCHILTPPHSSYHVALLTIVMNKGRPIEVDLCCQLGSRTEGENALSQVINLHYCLLLPQTERDVSVRQRAADLLYAMCDRTNAKQIVSEMLSYLETADYSIREEIVSRVSQHRGWKWVRGSGVLLSWLIFVGLTGGWLELPCPFSRIWHGCESYWL